MNFNGLIKRAGFFLAAFALGIGATGLLFGFNMPRWGRGHRGHKKQFVKQLKADKQRLEAENEELKRELEMHLNGEAHGHGSGSATASAPIAPPPPPPLPKAPPVPHDHK